MSNKTLMGQMPAVANPASRLILQLPRCFLVAVSPTDSRCIEERGPAFCLACFLYIPLGDGGSCFFLSVSLFIFLPAVGRFEQEKTSSVPPPCHHGSHARHGPPAPLVDGLHGCGGKPLFLCCPPGLGVSAHHAEIGRLLLLSVQGSW